MSRFNKNLSLVSRGLRYKLRIAFGLMSVIPLLVCIYLFFYYGPYIGSEIAKQKVPFSNLQVILSLVVSIFIAVIGFVLAKQMIDPIVEMSSEAKNIAKGEFNRTIEVYREDEIGDLGNALNQLTRRIRDNMEELRNYGERTKQINSEINKRVVILSGLLQISNLITQGASLKEVFDISISKLAQLKNASWVLLVLKDQYDVFKIRAQYNMEEKTEAFLLKDGNRKILDTVLLNKNGWIIAKDEVGLEAEELREVFDSTSIVFIPVYRHIRIIGFLGVGNSQVDNPYEADDLELLSIFAKQISIGIENDYLTNRLMKLEIKDSLTGLYNKNFIVSRLDEEIKRAIIYQRPCSFLLFSIDRFNEFLSSFGQLAAEDALKRVSKILEESCSEIDRIARYGDYEFAIVVPEKNKKQSVNLAEDIRKKISESFSQEGESKKLIVSGAVSENPIDGASSKDLIDKAERLLNLAKAEKNIIKF